MTLNEFFEDLDHYESAIPLEELREKMELLKVNLPDLNGALRFGEKNYQRTLLHKGPAYEALLICWSHGQRSPIHDHRGSACGVRVLCGSATETRFELSGEGYVHPVGTDRLSEGETTASADADIHQVSNLQRDRTDLVTLHVYSPPLRSMRSYSIESSDPEGTFGPAFRSRQGAVPERSDIKINKS